MCCSIILSEQRDRLWPTLLLCCKTLQSQHCFGQKALCDKSRPWHKEVLTVSCIKITECMWRAWAPEMMMCRLCCQKKLKSKGELLQFRVVHMYRAMRSNQHLKHTHTHMHTHITPPFVVSKSLLWLQCLVQWADDPTGSSTAVKLCMSVVPSQKSYIHFVRLSSCLPRTVCEGIVLSIDDDSQYVWTKFD